MEVERKRSKGGFLNLFDWNGKSRKNLFSSNSESSGSRQGKENAESSSKPGLDRVEVDENASSSNKGSDWNCASSVTSDEGYGTRAPGVVARLMGLESLPAPTAPELSSTFGSHSHRVPPNDRGSFNMWSDFHGMECINMPNKLDKLSWNCAESRTEEMHSRLIARFQTEVLPPKSAKSIPITHHKLLSPIKSAGFIPTKNAAYIMEAASRIIEASPRASAKSKVSAIGPSSIPLRIRDLKEKMEAEYKASRPERPKEVSVVQFMKGVSGDRSHSRSDSVPVPKASLGSERQHKNTRNKGKSLSLAEQAKVNAQRREGSTSSSNRSSVNQKEQNEVKRNQFPKSRLIAQRPPRKRISPDSTKTVLKQNNQKQNCVSNKDKKTSKNIALSQPTGRSRSTTGSNQPNKNASTVLVNSETGSGKMGAMENGTGKEFSLSTLKNVSRKSRSASDNVHSEENGSDNAFISEGERSIKCNVSTDGCTNLGTNNRKQDTDVVSFTFTSPLKRSVSEMQSYGQVRSTNNSFYIDLFGNNDQRRNTENFTLSSPGINLIGGDALSVLLEQKLQELSGKVESSQRNLSNVTSASASSFSTLPDMVSSVANITPRDKRLELGLLREKLDSIDDYDCLSVDVNQQWQGSEGMEECSSSSSINRATGEEFDYQYLSPPSALEPSLETQRCTDNRISANGSNGDICSLAQPQDQTNFSPYQILPPYGVSDLFDSASSASTSNASGNMCGIWSSHYLNGKKNWALGYVTYILGNVDLTMEDFALGDAHNVITPSLFDHLESQEEEYPKLQRKILFDCVNEGLQFKCKQHFGGSQRAWDRWATLSQKRGWLAEELYKDISGWKNMEELLVDELVDKDMSTQLGKWLDFDIEAFEEGLEIEKEILSSLVDELVSDLWHL